MLVGRTTGADEPSLIGEFKNESKKFGGRQRNSAPFASHKNFPSGENFPLQLVRHLLWPRLTILGVSSGRLKVGLRDFSLTVNAAEDAGFSATRGP